MSISWIKNVKISLKNQFLIFKKLENHKIAYAPKPIKCFSWIAIIYAINIAKWHDFQHLNFQIFDKMLLVYTH